MPPLEIDPFAHKGIESRIRDLRVIEHIITMNVAVYLIAETRLTRTGIAILHISRILFA